jgi:hypothetical protein
MKAIKYNYRKGMSALGYYECPHCLDFHLTSQYDNRNKKMKRKCFEYLKLPTTNYLLKYRIRDMYNHLGLPVPVMELDTSKWKKPTIGYERLY